MVDLKAGSITKAASKTERHDGTAITWDLGPIPGLLDMLRAIPEDQRIGPVIKRGGKPFEKEAYRNLWRRICAQVGVPMEVQMRDTRAGAINDAKRAGASLEDRQRMANHASLDTTERYNRGHDEVRNKVIKLRRGE